MKYEIREVLSNSNGGIFLVEFSNAYDLAMTFLRYQEYYESDNPKFRGKKFNILDYMDWYSNKRDGSTGIFTYPGDWAGFNIPDTVYYDLVGDRPDVNKYDSTMDAIVSHIKWWKKQNAELNPSFYLIGCVKDSEDVMMHEVAHGLYYLDPVYRKKMNGLYKNLTDAHKKILETYFTKLGYAKKVWKDETQAYLATGDFNWAEARLYKNILNEARSGILNKK